MKIKTGQYFRKGSEINKIDEIETADWFETGVIKTYIGYRENFAIELDELIEKYKVADTPQELIQGEDIIKRRMFIHNTEHMSIPLAVSGNLPNGKVLIYADMQTVRYEDIVEILTPNNNGGYDLQYSVDNFDK